MDPLSLGKYTLLSRLAWGGMAELYLARANDPARAAEVLVVKLVARRFAEDHAFVTMFEDEARIAARLDHPHIGRVVDVGEHDGRHFLAMEYLHGKDLRSICRRSLDLDRGPVPPEVAVRIGIKVCSALQHAHTARGPDDVPLNIIHRDVSPSNVMLTFDGRVKLVDFGIAKAANRTTLTQPGLIKGKLRYLSPEQVLGMKIDHRTDIFIFGTTLWECTLGRHLFEGTDEALIYQAISAGRVPPPSSIREGYPPRLEAAVLRALSKERTDRFPTAREMQDALEGVAEDLGVDLTQDRRVLSRYLAELFQEEVEGWRRASQHGRSLLQHVIDTTPPAPDDQEPDLDVNPRPLPAKPRRTLIYGEPPTAVSGTVQPIADREPPAQLEAIPLRAFRPSEAVPVVKPSGTQLGLPAKLAVTSPAGSTTQSALGAPEARSLAASQPASPAQGQVVGEIAGHPIEPADSARPTMIEPDQLRTMPFIREESLDRASAGPGLQASGPVLEPSAEAPGRPAEAPARPAEAPARPAEASRLAAEPAPAAPAAPADTVAFGKTVPSMELVLPAADVVLRGDGAGGDGAGGDDEDLVAEPEPKRPKTGDWAHQRFSGNTRPGTHPMFKKDERSSSAPVPVDGPEIVGGMTVAPVREPEDDDLAYAVPRRFGGPKVLLGVFIAVALLAVGALTLWLLLFRGAAPEASGHTSRAAGGTPAAALTPPPTAGDVGAGARGDAAPASVSPPRSSTALTTTPADVTVYDAASGRELGRTPLALAPGIARVELRLSGYRSRRVVLDGRPALHVVLAPEARAPGKRVRRPRRRPRGAPAANKTDGDLVDPFGKR